MDLSTFVNDGIPIICNKFGYKNFKVKGSI